jgi:hypothetical protein
MRSLLNKTFVIGLLITIIAIVAVSFKDIKMLFNPETAVLGETEQQISLDESQPQLILQEEKEENNQISSLQVPIFWKYEIISNNGTDNAIHGYIPNLEKYQRWYEYIYDEVTRTEGLDTIKDFTLNNLEIVKGVENKSEEFAYDELSCIQVNQGSKNIGICPTWISLTNETIANKRYILVKCPKFDNEQLQGYCLFEDYRTTYYNYSKDMDTKCLGEDFTNLYCTVEEYLNILD